MKALDVILLAAILTLASCLIVIPKRIIGILKPLVALTILGALIQFLIEGYYWHYLSSYVLILVMFVTPMFLESSSKIKKRLMQFTLALLVLTAIIPWAIFLPIPTLTEPQGDYAVGTRIFRWVDLDRAELITSDPSDIRNVIVQAWYPTENDTKGTHSSYIDGMNNLPESIGILPKEIFDHYDKIDTYGIENASLSKEQNKWPVIIFLTGNGAARAFYTSLVAGLASYGYVVLAIDHPYESMITQLADGKIATTIEVPLNDDPDLTKFMKGRIDLRIEDVQFLINQLVNPKEPTDNFLSSLDVTRIAIAGHSLGGATAAVAMAFDSRIKAAANIDGTLYGELPKPNGARPFLLLESKKDGSDRFERYENGNRKFFKQFEGSYRYELLDADHYSFTDAPLLFAFPTRFLTSRMLEFGNIPTKTHNATVDILNSFFSESLNNESHDIDSVISQHQGIIRKSID
jgi:dienelactone hydrolase